MLGVAGFAPEVIRKNYIWNRVANIKGKPHGNVGLDLVNEHLNLDFKGNVNTYTNWTKVSTFSEVALHSLPPCNIECLESVINLQGIV